jgi:hypothetical protein
MGREQMRNLEVVRSSGTQINEFEYQKHQGEMTEQEHADKQGGGGRALSQAERVKQVMAAAHKKVEKRRKKGTSKPSARRKASASSSTASSRPAAKVQSAKKAVAGKSAGGKTMKVARKR